MPGEGATGFATIDTTHLGGVAPLAQLVTSPITLAVRRDPIERERHLEAAAVDRERLFTSRTARAEHGPSR